MTCAKHMRGVMPPVEGKEIATETEPVTTPAREMSEDVATSVEKAYEQAEKAETEEGAQQELPLEAKAKPKKEAKKESAKPAAKKEISTTDSEQVTKPVGQKKAPVEESEEEEKLLPPPHSWNKDARADWNTLPRKLQQYLVQMEKDIQADHTKKTQEIARVAQRYEELDRIVAPYERDLALRGVSLPRFVRQALETDKLLRSGPEGAIQFLRDYYRIDPRTLVASAPRQNGNAVPAQQAQAFEGMINPVLGRISQLEQRLMQRDQRERQQTQETVGETVQRFREEQDEDGNLKHPYVDQVYQEMAHHMALGRRRNPKALPQELLQQAYDFCCWGNPSIREKIEQDRSLKEEALRQAEERARVAKAKKAGASLPVKGGGAASEAIPDDLPGLVAYAYDALE